MGNVKRQKGELRKLAQGAMKRMKTGYWQEAKETKSAAKAKAAAEGRDAGSVDNFYRSKFETDLKVTIQALGWRNDGKENRYLPLQDDISSVAYWYQTLPAKKFPEFPHRDYCQVI